ncbi:unnamed protein product [Blepharisma stoltei]|uniref:RAP domain-containing protein n=1 Tax=Blepharisma stoltei TaxID=1481888 RepID=A0AAU9IQR3_9CILI|nr:unnamed protein product [Blepharisma stoltei]
MKSAISEFLNHRRSWPITINWCRSLCEQINVNDIKPDEFAHLADKIGDIYRKFGYRDYIWKEQITGKIWERGFIDTLDLKDRVNVWKGAIFIGENNETIDFLRQKLVDKIIDGNAEKVSIAILTRILDCMNTTNYNDPKIINFIENLLKSPESSDGKITGNFVGTLLSTYGKLRVDPTNVYPIISEILASKFSLYSHNLKASVAHSLALNGIADENLWTNTIFKELLKINHRTLTTWKLSEIHHTLIILELLHPFFKETKLYNSGKYKNMKKKTQEAWDRVFREKYKKDYRNMKGYCTLWLQSRLHKDIFSTFKKLKIKLMPEYQTEYPYTLDVDLLYPPNTVIEIQGPYHYIKPNFELCGKTVIKNQLLEKLGYRVINIPHFKWDSLKNDQKPDYLLSLLK